MNPPFKILYTATSDIHLKTFHFPYLQWLKNQGFEIHAAFENRGNFEVPYCDEKVLLPFKRFPFHPKNLKAFKALKALIKKNDYKLIHCHTPTVSVLTRLAAIGARKKGTKVLFTAHGFHFFKGAAIFSWIFYFAVEKLLSFFTDAIITINDEDFARAQKSFSTASVFKLNGMGVNAQRFLSITESKPHLKVKLGYKEDDFVVLLIGELNANKNQEFVLKALKPYCSKYDNVVITMIGKGAALKNLQALAQELSIKVDFLGWRNDVDAYTKVADIGISASKREGLGIALIEQMMSGVPVIASDNRGHREIIIQGQNGFLYEQENQVEFMKYFDLLYSNNNMRNELGLNARETAMKFSLTSSVEQMATVYRYFLK